MNERRKLVIALDWTLKVAFLIYAVDESVVYQP